MQQQIERKLRAVRSIGVVGMIAVGALIIQVLSALPWQIDAAIAAVAVLGWAYRFERTGDP